MAVKKAFFTFIIMLMLSAIAVGVYLFCYSPLSIPYQLSPVSDLIEVRFQGYLQRTEVGTYVLWDSKCRHTTVAAVPDELATQNQTAFNQLNVEYLPDRNIAFGNFEGYMKRRAFIARGKKANSQMYFDMRKLNIKKSTTISAEFGRNNNCELIR